MKLWKYSGTYLTVTGIIHTIYALFSSNHYLLKAVFCSLCINQITSLANRPQAINLTYVLCIIIFYIPYITTRR